jgi:hypothetical protein
MILTLKGPVAKQVDEGTVWVAAALFFACDTAGIMVLSFVPLNLRPAILFYRELKPLLLDMRAGLISFAFGYFATAFLFAGIYAALYRQYPQFFAEPTDMHVHGWDFVYFH